MQILKKTINSKSDFEYVMDIAQVAGTVLSGTEKNAKKIKDGKDDRFRSGFTTEGDVHSLGHITNMLLEKFPEHGILAEGLDEVDIVKHLEFEMDTEDGIIQSENGFYWVIDPLCGTIMHEKGMGDYIVSIALVDEDANIQFGCVYHPRENSMYHAVKEKGAFLTRKNKREPIYVSETKRIKDSLVSIEHGICKNLDYDIRPLLQIIKRQRTAGTCGLELSLTANGNMDAAMKKKQPLYDFAAGLLIVEEAGGIVTDFDGNKIKKELSYNKVTDLICSNGYVHDQILDYTKGFNLRNVMK